MDRRTPTAITFSTNQHGLIMTKEQSVLTKIKAFSNEKI